jgi:hypothetical protein
MMGEVYKEGGCDGVTAWHNIEPDDTHFRGLTASQMKA